MAETIAVFGSAFNPPSLGHKSILERLHGYDRVLLLPSYAHAWGKQMLDYELRCILVDAFINDLRLDNLELSQLEEEMAVPGKAITTFAVLQELQLRNPEAELTFVIGPDNFLSFSKFYRAEEILSKWQVLACPETVQIRSTEIREKLRKGQDVSHLTTPNVTKLLEQSERFCFNQ